MNKDVGWWTVPSGSSLSLQHPVFQLRDVSNKQSKVLEEITSQKREETSSPKEDRGRIKVARNRDNNNTIQDSHQQRVKRSPLFKEDKLQSEERGSISDSTKGLLENVIQPVQQSYCSKYQQNSNSTFRNVQSLLPREKICYLCSKTFTANSSLKEHKQAVHDLLRFPCHCCKHMASSRRNLRGHKAKKHPNEKMSYLLHPVKMALEEAKQYNTRKHLKMKRIRKQRKTSWVHDPVPMDLECSSEALPVNRLESKKCCVSLRKSEDVNNLLEKQVEIVNTLRKKGLELRMSKTGDICDICGKTLLTRQGVYIHKQIIHFMEGKDCTICERKNMCKSNYMIHMMKHHR